MATTIKLKNSVTATNTPTSLVQGEVAINITDKKVWVGNAATTPIQLLGGGADGSFTNISVSSVATFGAGTVSAPSITTTGDTNTGIFFPAADTIAFTEGGVESMRIDSSGNVGIGTSSPVFGSGSGLELYRVGTATYRLSSSGAGVEFRNNSGTGELEVRGAFPLVFGTNATERMRITSGGDLLVGTTSASPAQNNATGFQAGNGGITEISAGSTVPLYVNRAGNDGGLVSLRQAGTQEGDISVSGSTVSYNGGHLSRWSQLPDGSKDESIVKGTVMSNLDDMCVWEKDGVVANNEQLNKMKVSDVEGDTNVAGVFVNWTIDEDYGVDDMNVAMTGDMIIRIAEGVVVQKGDLLMSAGDGTAKPQGDDIVRSKTIAKVTSNHVTCTYTDGSYCVPCVLMAC